MRQLTAQRGRPNGKQGRRTARSECVTSGPVALSRPSISAATCAGARKQRLLSVTGFTADSVLS
jgi:hypothetical protein